MKRQLPYGISDFKEIRENDYYYIDKSLLIQEILESGANAILLPRPRRFGKTLNLSMLRYFFEKSSPTLQSLFEGLKIFDQLDCMQHQGKYPVVFLTFKDLKKSSFEGATAQLKKILSDEYRRHKAILDCPELEPLDKKIFEQICNRDADEVDLESSLKELCRLLFITHHQKPIVLIDEYDTPILTGYEHGYYEEIVDFFRYFLGAGLKDNSYLEKAVITGILRIAKESIFSDLNNLKVCSLLSHHFSEYFGFLESEVEQLVANLEVDSQINLQHLQQWYNGYNFAGMVVYNPWSVLSYLDAYPDLPRLHWANTSSNAWIKQLIKKKLFDYHDDLTHLLQGTPLPCNIRENIVFSEIETLKVSLWGFFLFTGYLTAKNERMVYDRLVHDLMIPNLEVKQLFQETILEWFEPQNGGHTVQEVLKALTEGKIDTFVALLQEVVLTTLSTFDTARPFVENSGHMFVLGLLVNLEGRYTVRSNREAGTGRYDIALEPRLPGEPGFIFEFKAAKNDGPEGIQSSLAEAIAQIHDRQYYTELLAHGVQKICCIALVFAGKTIHHRFEWEEFSAGSGARPES